MLECGQRRQTRGMWLDVWWLDGRMDGWMDELLDGGAGQGNSEAGRATVGPWNWKLAGAYPSGGRWCSLYYQDVPILSPVLPGGGRYRAVVSMARRVRGCPGRRVRAKNKLMGYRAWRHGSISTLDSRDGWSSVDTTWTEAPNDGESRPFGCWGRIVQLISHLCFPDACSGAPVSVLSPVLRASILATGAKTGCG